MQSTWDWACAFLWLGCIQVQTACFQAEEAQAEHKEDVKGLEAEIERLGKTEEMSSMLIKDMQKQLDEYAHSTSELEVLRSGPMHAAECQQAMYCHLLPLSRHAVRRAGRGASLMLQNMPGRHQSQ